MGSAACPATPPRPGRPGQAHAELAARSRRRRPRERLRRRLDPAGLACPDGRAPGTSTLHSVNGDPALSNQLDTDPLLVNLEQFQGPLDLLLHLIRKQDIDIFDIPIARITAQFLEVISEMGRLELERAGEFIEMAATLVRIKAQLLFPRRQEETGDDPRAELVRRLLEYEHFRDVARTLEAAERERLRFHAKGFLPPRPRATAAAAPLETQWSEVWEALLSLADRLARPDPGYVMRGRLVRVEEKIDQIVQALSGSSRVEFSALVAPWGTRMHAVMSLLACLELAKRSTLTLRQVTPFAPLWLYRREKVDAA
jgi:segregation and condensation protein A